MFHELLFSATIGKKMGMLVILVPEADNQHHTPHILQTHHLLTFTPSSSKTDTSAAPLGDQDLSVDDRTLTHKHTRLLPSLSFSSLFFPVSAFFHASFTFPSSLSPSFHMFTLISAQSDDLRFVFWRSFKQHLFKNMKEKACLTNLTSVRQRGKFKALIEIT